jgi:transposase
MIPRKPGDFVKTDRLDSRKLAEFLAKGLLRGIYQWDEESLRDRSLVRKRRQMVKRRVQIQLQIKSDLAFYGIDIERMKTGYWSIEYISGLKDVAKRYSANYYGAAFSLLIEEYEQLLDHIRKVTKLIVNLSREEKYRDKVALLCRIPGISVLSAMILLTEIGDICRFTNQEKFVSYLGLTPSEHSSGDKKRQGSLTGMGHSKLRSLFIEISWVAIRKDPVLLNKFNRTRIGKSKTKSIVAVAKSMANRIRHTLITGEPYVIGVVA